MWHPVIVIDSQSSNREALPASKMAKNLLKSSYCRRFTGNDEVEVDRFDTIEDTPEFIQFEEGEEKLYKAVMKDAGAEYYFFMKGSIIMNEEKSHKLPEFKGVIGKWVYKLLVHE